MNALCVGRLVPLGIVLAASLAAGCAARAQDVAIAECDGFRARWSGLIGRASPGHPPLAFGTPASDKVQQATNARGARIRLRCQEARLVRIEIAEEAGASPGQNLRPFQDYSASAVMALDPQMAASEAAATVETLRAETQGGKPGVSSLGPYELSLTRAGAVHELLIEFPEN